MLAKELGIKTIAEYIFSEEVYEKAKEFGIDEFQGYYFGQPTAEI
jgi:EAL domain-containing protein (putative c-di-GMP-specific phosphodiesterase class I)